MPKKTSRKKAKPGNEDKAKVTRIVDEIVSESSPLPDTTHLFSKIRELENTTSDYTAILLKKFSKSAIDEQLFMINHLFPHLKRLSLSESIISVLTKETFAPRILVDILHYLIRSDKIVDTQLLESATKAGEIANQLSARLEAGAEVAQVVGVGAGEHGVEAPLVGQGLQLPQQLGLAVEAAIGGVGGVLWVGQLARVDLDELRADPPGQVAPAAALAPG